jgi:hypothetical protein
MDLFLHEAATFRACDSPGPEAIREYLESPAVNADDQPAFDAAFRAARSHSPKSLGRLLARRYHGAVYGDAGCAAWMLTVTGTKLLAIVAIYAWLNWGTTPPLAVFPFTGWGVGLLVAGLILVALNRRRNRAECRELVDTLRPLSERDPGALVETLPLLERLASDRAVAETTRSAASAVAARVRGSVRSELPVAMAAPVVESRWLPYSLGEAG